MWMMIRQAAGAERFVANRSVAGSQRSSQPPAADQLYGFPAQRAAAGGENEL